MLRKMKFIEPRSLAIGPRKSKVQGGAFSVTELLVVIGIEGVGAISRLEIGDTAAWKPALPVTAGVHGQRLSAC
jgi:hypothetical protein